MDYRSFYETRRARVSAARTSLGRPLTLTEKTLVAHLAEVPKSLKPGDRFRFLPDRVNCQDATAQMALLLLELSRLTKLAIPGSLHLDHLAMSTDQGAAADLARAMSENAEVYAFLRSAAGRFGLDRWDVGGGIIHDVVLRAYAIPGMLGLGTDSHSSHACGLAAIMAGVGGGVGAQGLLGLGWKSPKYKTMGIRLRGSLRTGVTPKDVILYICKLIGADGAKDFSAEYFGPGLSGFPATGIATIGNMGVECGFRYSTSMLTDAMLAFLKATGRAEVAELAGGEFRNDLAPDVAVTDFPEKYYDELLEIDLSTVPVYISGPNDVGKVRTPAEIAQAAQSGELPARLSLVRSNTIPSIVAKSLC